MPLIYHQSHSDGSYKAINLITADRLKDPCYVSTLGKTSFEKLVYDPQGWTKYLLLYSASGYGIAHLNGKELRLPAGSALLYAPNQAIHYRSDGSAPWTTYWITFQGPACASLLNITEHALLEEGCDFIRETVQTLWNADGRTDWEEYAAAHLYHLLLLLRNRLERSDYSAMQQIQKKLADSMKYMLEHSTSDIPLSKLAEMSGIGEAYYCRLFKRLNGVRPIEYLNALRVSQACILLQSSPEKTVEQVCYETGFRNYTYFITAFRRWMGVSPGVYRQNPLAYRKPPLQEIL